MRQVGFFAVLSIFLFVLFFQLPSLFKQQIFAAESACHCVDHSHGYGGAYGNAFECDDGSYGACNHDEEKCVADANANVGGGMVKHTENDSSGNPDTLKGVRCQTTIQCSCTNNNAKISCTDPDRPNYPGETFDCQGAGKVCVTGKNLTTGEDLVHDVGNGQQVKGIDCQPAIRCQHPGLVGDGNNWSYKSNDPGNVDMNFCQHREQACIDNTISTSSPLYKPEYSNLPTGYAFCKSDIVCKCSADQQNIICDSPGTNQHQQFNCDRGRKCVQAPNLVHVVFNQNIQGIDCSGTGGQNVVYPVAEPPCVAGAKDNMGRCTAVLSAFGPFSTDPAGFILRVFGILIALSGAIALLLIMRAGYKIMTSRGNPEGIKEGREQIIAAVVGLIFLIFSFVFLQIIGGDLLRIPGFTAGSSSIISP